MRKQTEKKIEAIIKGNFEPELAKKHEEIDSIDEVIFYLFCCLIQIFFFEIKCFEDTVSEYWLINCFFICKIFSVSNFYNCKYSN